MWKASITWPDGAFTIVPMPVSCTLCVHVYFLSIRYHKNFRLAVEVGCECVKDNAMCVC